MGYDQYLSLTLERGCKDEKSAKVFFSLVEHRLCVALGTDREHFDEYREEFQEDKAVVVCRLQGRRIYSDDGYLGDESDKTGVRAADLSKELSCSVDADYEGEDRGDAEELRFENGKRVRASVSITVDLENDCTKRLNEILNGVREKGLEDEADRIGSLFTEIVARYVFR